MNKEKFSNPPITEALLDIQIEPAITLSSEKIEKAHAEFADKYPAKRAGRLMAMTVNKENSKPEHEDKGIQAYQFLSTNKTEAAQFKLNGFSFSKLKPYISWEDFLPEAIRLWRIYLEEFKPRFIKRLALRYINVIEIPSTKFEIRDYFTQPIEPPYLSKDLENFLSRVVIRLEDEMHAIVTITPLEPAKPGASSIVFDIDVFSTGHFSDVPEKLKEEFTKLHNNVLDIFEKGLTPKTKELFK